MLHPRFYRAGDVLEIYVEVQPINDAKNACMREVDLRAETAGTAGNEGAP